MAKYCGYESKFLVSSLKKADAFLRQQDIGPSVATLLDAWKAKSPYEEILKNQKDKDLVTEMHDTDTLSTFATLYDVLYVHALADTDGSAREIYEELLSWGAFSQDVTLFEDKISHDVTAHFLDFYKEHIDYHFAPETPIPVNARNNSDVLDSLCRDSGVKTIGQAVTVLQDLFDREKIKDFKIKEALHQLSALDNNANLIQAKPPLQSYGIVIGTKNEPLLQMQKKAREFQRDVQFVLDDYQDLDEAGDVLRLGPITADGEVFGLQFFATENAVHDVMRTIPEQTVVHYDTGEPVRLRRPFPGKPRPYKPDMK